MKSKTRAGSVSSVKMWAVEAGPGPVNTRQVKGGEEEEEGRCEPS